MILPGSYETSPLLAFCGLETIRSALFHARYFIFLRNVLNFEVIAVGLMWRFDADVGHADFSAVDMHGWLDTVKSINCVNSGIDWCHWLAA